VAAESKWEAVNHLDTYLEQFEQNLTANGARVHWAADAKSARDIILEIIREKKALSIVKAKSMTSEEIHLNEALEAEGYAVVESDLGEFIVQLRKEAPYHIVFPAMHLTRGEISELFARELGSERTNNPEALTMIARRVLRQKYITADIGLTGANFAVAETGMISITENEGNARLTAALPRVMITLVGIEKIVPRLNDLALLLPMLSTIGTGQALSCYNSFYTGPRRQGEVDGPEEHHVVLLDNGRTTLLADAEQRDALALHPLRRLPECLPDYRNRRPHLRHHLLRAHRRGHHAQPARPRGVEASFLRLVALRRVHGNVPGPDQPAPPPAAEPAQLHENRTQIPERLAFRLFAFVINRPAIYRLAKAAGRLHRDSIHGSKARGWTQHTPDGHESCRRSRRRHLKYWRQRQSGQKDATESEAKPVASKELR
jgi:L-lactate dehydrogenase complex protein LldF